MKARNLSRKVALASLAGAGATIALTGAAKAAPKVFSAGVIHRFSEVASDRPGYRKYVGATTGCTITGTLLGIYDDDHVPPGAVGGVAIAHTVFFYAKDFLFTTKPGLSTFYAPVGLKLPDELLAAPPH